MRQALLLLLIVGCFIAISQLFVLEFTLKLNFLWEREAKWNKDTNLFTSPITFKPLSIQSEYMDLNVYRDHLQETSEDVEEEEHFKNLPPFKQSGGQFISNNPITVELPNELSHCFAAKIKFYPRNWEETKISLIIRDEITITIECYTPSDNFFVKTLPILVGEYHYYAHFYPDEGTQDCLLTVDSEKLKLEGTLRRSYTVKGIPSAVPWCWNCEAHFHRYLPMPYDFLLVDNELNELWSKSEIVIKAGSKLILWIVPVTPRLKEQYSEAVQSLLFNAWMESETIIQKADVSTQYDATKGGYKVEIVGQDVESFKLYVTLNWVFPFAEIGDITQPVLVGTHIHHETSICDLERAQIINSQYPITVQLGKYEQPLLFPKVPKQCTSASEPGRWLKLDLNQDCEPPYCAGDRYSTLVSSYSWQGTVYPWIWVPYNCHYRYYNATDFNYCAQELGHKWFLFLGDSLAREYVAYLMSMMGDIDTEKFETADIVLNGTDIRVTFSVWHDIVLHGILASPPDHERPISFTKDLLDHFNVLQRDTSRVFALPDLFIDFYKKETKTPDVLLMSPATAYCLYLQSKETYKKYIQDVSELVSSADLPKNSYWYQSPYLHGTAHAGTDLITQGRNIQFAEITKDFLSPKLKYFDSWFITQPRPMESWDGLHYLSGYETWTGHVAATYIQAWFNELFSECKIGQSTKAGKKK